MGTNKDREAVREEYVEIVAAELVTATLETGAAAVGVEHACDMLIEELLGLDGNAP
jgi:hypothetical protein